MTQATDSDIREIRDLLQGVDKKIDSLDKKIDIMDTRLVEVEKKIEKLDLKIDNQNEDMNTRSNKNASQCM
jgi:peptidoglycan hydrolase CwlO-like protein